jgi:hypothetical protein
MVAIYMVGIDIGIKKKNVITPPDGKNWKEPNRKSKSKSSSVDRSRKYYAKFDLKERILNAIYELGDNATSTNIYDYISYPGNKNVIRKQLKRFRYDGYIYNLNGDERKRPKIYGLTEWGMLNLDDKYYNIKQIKAFREQFRVKGLGTSANSGESSGPEHSSSKSVSGEPLPDRDFGDDMDGVSEDDSEKYVPDEKSQLAKKITELKNEVEYWKEQAKVNSVNRSVNSNNQEQKEIPKKKKSTEQKYKRYMKYVVPNGKVPSDILIDGSKSDSGYRLYKVKVGFDVFSKGKYLIMHKSRGTELVEIGKLKVLSDKRTIGKHELVFSENKNGEVYIYSKKNGEYYTVNSFALKPSDEWKRENGYNKRVKIKPNK